MAQIRIAQLGKFEERVHGMPIYCTPVKIGQELSLTDMIRKLEQQMERIVTAQLYTGVNYYPGILYAKSNYTCTRDTLIFQ